MLTNHKRFERNNKKQEHRLEKGKSPFTSDTRPEIRCGAILPRSFRTDQRRDQKEDSY